MLPVPRSTVLCEVGLANMISSCYDRCTFQDHKAATASGAPGHGIVRDLPAIIDLSCPLCYIHAVPQDLLEQSEKQEALERRAFNFGTILGLRRVVEDEVASLKGEARTLVPRHVADVDAFIDRGRLPTRQSPLRGLDPSLF